MEAVAYSEGMRKEKYCRMEEIDLDKDHMLSSALACPGQIV